MKLCNKKVLVTGSEGFIGSHLVERLVEEGCEVRAFVWYNSFNSLGWIDTFPKQMLKKLDIFMGDIRDTNNVREAMRGVDVVFHLAALIGIPFSYHSPESYIDTNVKGTLNILQASRDVGVDKVLVTSTSEAYGTAKYAPIDEHHPRQGQSPYSATKIAADALADSFHRSFGLPVVLVRPFNTYGPRQSSRAIIPTVIIQLLSGMKEIKLGSIHPTRDFVYVKDTAEAFVRIALSDKTIGEEINIATNKEISIKRLVEEIMKMIDREARIVKDKARIRPQGSEVERLVGRNTKIKRVTGWQPEYSLKEGLRRTIEWFNDPVNRKGYRHDIYNV